uniref:Uncharacterized protein n=1 Tax=Arundo donax TaxID=35708 RepID=A0A0A9E233_ARUDO
MWIMGLHVNDGWKIMNCTSLWWSILKYFRKQNCQVSSFHHLSAPLIMIILYNAST